MKKLLIINIVILYLTILSSEELIKKVTLNNVEGYFIAQEYYQEILLIENENNYLKQLTKNNEIEIKLLKEENELLTEMNIALKLQLADYNKLYKTNKVLTITTAAGISISIAELLILMGGIYFFFQK